MRFTADRATPRRSRICRRRPPCASSLLTTNRRLLLRDSELPDVLLPAEWPGQKARLLCKELYRRLAPASERHLDRCPVLADGTIRPADPAFADRFPQTTRWRRCRCRLRRGIWGVGVDRGKNLSHLSAELIVTRDIGVQAKLENYCCLTCALSFL